MFEPSSLCGFRLFVGCRLILHFSEHGTRVVSTKSERIAQRYANFVLYLRTQYQIQIWRHTRIQAGRVDRGWDRVVLNGLDTNNGLRCARGAKQVACRRFRRADEELFSGTFKKRRYRLKLTDKIGRAHV